MSIHRPPGVSRLPLDSAIGTQRNSLRPTSGRFSFSSRPRFPDESKSRDTPGPGDYDKPSVFRGPSAVRDHALHSVSAVIGRAGAAMDSRPSADEQDGRREQPEASVPDSARLRFNAPPRATFGKEERMGKVMDFEYIRACPDHGYGADSPGPIYSPHERPARPRSAPGYTIRARKEPVAQGDSQKRSSTPTKVAPNSYPGAREGAIGVQLSSRRRTASASSFGRADRFPAPKPAGGTLTEECANVRSVFGEKRSGRCNVGFGSARREGTAHANGSREADHNLARPPLPHPPLAPRQELLRYGDNLGKAM
jgi:hypothetical protein